LLQRSDPAVAPFVKYGLWGRMRRSDGNGRVAPLESTALQALFGGVFRLDRYRTMCPVRLQRVLVKKKTTRSP
jgi:hypothetical protein